jgi:predicted CoA-substrate-specific enzyme activase
MIYYICKYTPVELLAGFGAQAKLLDSLPENFDRADSCGHPNLCGYGKAIIEKVSTGTVKELVLVNCCDTIRRIYDILREKNYCTYLYFMDLPHETGHCQVELFTAELFRLAESYKKYSGKEWNYDLFKAAFGTEKKPPDRYIALIGAHAGPLLSARIKDSLNYPIENLTCAGNREVLFTITPEQQKSSRCLSERILAEYARELLQQLPCMRMNDTGSRRRFWNAPGIAGIIYHSIKFCDYYGAEYAELKDAATVPLLKIESDYTRQSSGQFATRLGAFSELLHGTERKNQPRKGKVPVESSAKNYFAGIDSGSTSTDVVILDGDCTVAGWSIIPTGGGASSGAEKCLSAALKKAGISRGRVRTVISTGYGRKYIQGSTDNITEITCHAKGAFFLNKKVRTIIDIGGQDSKIIALNDDGSVAGFVMNDKCSAGTGRFLDMMSNALNIPLEKMSSLGLNCTEDITISSMCTVFAESEVVSLVAQNKSVNDIVYGLNKSVAAKISALAGRIRTRDVYMMTGGVAQNKGVVRAVENKMKISLCITDYAQICGALGAALFAVERC